MPLSKTVLAKDTLVCTLLALAPGEETATAEGQATREQMLYVAEGAVTVRIGDLNYLLHREEALHVPAGKEHAILAHASGWAKLLRVEFTPREIVSHPIYTFDP